MNSIVGPAARKAAARPEMLERELRRYHPPLQGGVRKLAAQHSRVADLALSFPALLFALAVPRPGLDPARALACAINGESLPEVAAAAELPMWLRKLPPEAFVRPIPGLPDGELFRRQIANHLPRSPKLATAWLQAVAEVAMLAHEQAAVWIAREVVREPKQVTPQRLRRLSLWAWFSTQPETFAHTLIERRWTPAMRIDQALGAAQDWREVVELQLYLGQRSIADMWLEPGQVGGYDFRPLSSPAAIVDEASSMRNCLRTYGYSVAHNRARLWSVRRDGARVATLRVAVRGGDPLPNIIELKGVGNVKVPGEMWWAARRWLHMHDLPGIEMKQRKWDTAPLDRMIWRSLWRPYWLAKRRIPQWLPMTPSPGALHGL